MAFGEMGGIWLKGESCWRCGWSWIIGVGIFLGKPNDYLSVSLSLFSFLFFFFLQISHDHQMRSKWGNLGGNWVVGGRLGFWGEM